MKPKLDHLQITVKDFNKAVKFYDKLMPILGYDLSLKNQGRVDANDFDVVEYVHPLLTFGINSPRKEFINDDVHRRTPGSVHHIAFRAESNEEIDQLYPLIEDIGAHIVNPPKFYPQHGEKYYALFFKDLDGIKLEIMFEGKS